MSAAPIDPMGPFSLGHDPDRENIARLAGDLLEACWAMAHRQFAHRQTAEASAIPGASIIERSATSSAIQALYSAACEAHHHAFNVVDGWAHGIGATLAQSPPEARLAAMDVLGRNIVGYEKRTREAMTRPDGKGDA
jgi:hypothetical protein